MCGFEMWLKSAIINMKDEMKKVCNDDHWNILPHFASKIANGHGNVHNIPGGKGI